MRKNITIFLIIVILLSHSLVSAQDIVENQAEDNMETMRGLVLGIDEGTPEDHFQFRW